MSGRKKGIDSEVDKPSGEKSARASRVDRGCYPDKPQDWDSDDFGKCRYEALKPQPASTTKLEKWLLDRKNLIAAYRDGYGTEPDHRRYLELLLQLAEFQEKKADPNGISPMGTDAIWELAIAYKDGMGVEKSDIKYLDWLRRAAEAGDRTAMVDLAEEGRETNKADFFKWTQKLAKLEHPPPKALIDLSEAYRDGHGEEQNDSEHFSYAEMAVEYSRKAIERSESDPNQENQASEDLPAALKLLATAYRMGWGVRKNQKTYLRLLQEAVEAVDNAIAYAKREDRPKVEEIEMRAAPIREELAIAFEKGIGTVSDLKKAFKIMKRAAEGDLASAMRRLAFFYLEGFGTAKNKPKYFHWIEKAAQSGDLDGMYQCALAYGTGQGTNVDPGQFLEWITRAEFDGHPKAFMARGLAELQKDGLLKPSQMSDLLDQFDALRKKVLIRKEDHELKKSEITANGIAHFTTLETLHSMLPRRDSSDSHGDRSGTNVMRLYNIQYLNDPEEGQVLLNPENKKSNLIRDFFPDAAMEEVGDSGQLGPYEPLPLRGLAFSVYVGSFTLRTDDLDLWRAYGNDGDGFCIITQYDSFGDMQSTSDGSFVDIVGGEAFGDRQLDVSIKLYEVRYGDDRANETIEKLMGSLKVIKLSKEKNTKTKSNERRNIIHQKINRAVQQILSDILFLYKNAHYKSEGEVRILAPFPIAARTVHLDEQNPAKLYAKTRPFLFSCGSKIVIGPKVNDPIRVRLELKKLLHTHNYPNVEVVPSRIKYR